ncbi:hypothetical protein QVD17_32233 [Tagetes erecta]|uniref:Uncharacterized protein n=1 Tax=Tagetes erecta TaxID=13708 RepID=A0AAD8K998_TARER|nr:hypothetical protein QVD17_32233 [Tagetes erecta]
MAISDVLVGNLTMLYLALIAAIKGYGQVSGRSYGGVSVLVISTAAIGVLLVGALTWDVSRKAATYAVVTRVGDDVEHEMCRGGICWHGVAVKSPASELRFRLPPRQRGDEKGGGEVVDKVVAVRDEVEGKRGGGEVLFRL